MYLGHEDVEVLGLGELGLDRVGERAQRVQQHDQAARLVPAQACTRKNIGEGGSEMGREGEGGRGGEREGAPSKGDNENENDIGRGLPSAM